MSLTSVTTDKRQIRSWSLLGIVFLMALVLVSGRHDVGLDWNSILLLVLLSAVTWISAQNALRTRHSIRLFWSLMAAGSGLWALNSILEIRSATALGKNLPDPMLSASLLFLHTTMMIGAVAVRPHVKQLEQRPSGAVLNLLFLLSFWVFIYAFFLISARLLGWNNASIRWFAALYFIANVVLAMMTAALAAHTQTLWRSVYLPLFAATALYSFSSLAANLSAPGAPPAPRLFDGFTTGAACLLLWAAICGKELAPQLESAAVAELHSGHSPGALGMLTATVPLIAMWALLRLTGPEKVYPVPLFAVLIAGLLLAFTIYLREYLQQRRLDFEVDLAHDQLHLAMQFSKSVGWNLNLARREGAWFGDLQAFFGIPVTDYVGPARVFYRYIHPDDRRPLLEALFHAMQSAKPYGAVFRLVLPDSSTRWLTSHGRFYYNTRGEPIRMLGIAVDVSERTHAVEALQKSDEEFSLAFEAARLGWCVWNKETGRFILSEGSRAVLGLPAQAEVSLDAFLRTVYPEDRERVYRIWRQSLNNDAPYFMEYRVLRPDGLIHWVETRGRAERGSGGKLKQMVGVVMDITDRKRAEETMRTLGGRLIQAQEEERVRISRELHDDICQRLALLGVELERLKDSPELSDPKSRAWMERLAQFTVEIGGSVQALSHKLHSSKLEILGTTAAMRSFCAEFAHQHHVEIEFMSNVSVALPREISLCLYRVLQEGLHNSVKHSGGRAFSVQLCRDPGAVELIIKDSGTGFDLETAIAGAGLGLISMQERINLVNGTMLIESAPMRGTTIRARVPVEEMNSSQCA